MAAKHILILLWVLASMSDIRYISGVVCFVAFFVNDIYGFISWRKMKIRQHEYQYGKGRNYQVNTEVTK